MDLSYVSHCRSKNPRACRNKRCPDKVHTERIDAFMFEFEHGDAYKPERVAIKTTRGQIRAAELREFLAEVAQIEEDRIFWDSVEPDEEAW